MPRLDIIFRDITQDEIDKLDRQRGKLGLTRTDYIRLMINLDAATQIIKKLKEPK